MSGVQQAVFQNQRSFGPPPDAQFNYVTMLLHGDGTNGAQNNTFLDSSTNAFSITRNGNTTQGSFSPYGSNWSNYFGGSDYLSLADNANLNPSTQDFVMEAWIYLAGTTGNNQGINGKGTPGTDGYTLFVTNALVLSFVWNGTGGATITGGTLVLNTWNHVAVVRNSSVIRLYLNGVGAGSSTACTTDITSTATKFVGQARGGNPILGYMSNYRMTKGSLPTGYDATSSSLTPPTAPLTAISGTSLLTCQSNRFVDNSASPLTITVNGTPSVQRFNPFGTSTAYSTSVIGGSGYFDGSGDYLGCGSQSAYAFGTSNFTMECWAYATSFISYNSLTGSRSNSSDGSTTNYSFGVDSGGSVYFYSAGFLVTSSAGAIKLNSWNHIALVRSGTGASQSVLYINGVSAGTGTISNNLSGTSFAVGGLVNGDEPFTGYITNVRLNNTALYSTTFTPPTAPLTAVSGTSLLLNTINGAIFDNAMMNDLETRGNAQISTSVKKYGTGSLAFDGTGDYLVSNAASSDLYAFGTGDFTIEFWLYLNSMSGLQVFYDGRPTSAEGLQPTIYTNSSGTLFYYTNVTNQITFNSLSTNTWYHIAVSRSGSSTKMFVDGTQAGSTYTDSTNYVNSALRPVIGADGYILGTNAMNGYIDDLRLTKGYARYTTTFSVPTAAFPDTGPV